MKILLIIMAIVILLLLAGLIWALKFIYDLFEAFMRAF